MHSLKPYRIQPNVAQYVEEYFQFISLYSLVEYLHFGTMEFQIGTQFSIARQARWAMGAKNRLPNSLSLPMLAALALLLTSVSGDLDGM
jgi:hypothetical protein